MRVGFASKDARGDDKFRQMMFSFMAFRKVDAFLEYLNNQLKDIILFISKSYCLSDFLNKSACFAVLKFKDGVYNLSYPINADP